MHFAAALQRVFKVCEWMIKLVGFVLIKMSIKSAVKINTQHTLKILMKDIFNSTLLLILINDLKQFITLVHN